MRLPPFIEYRAHRRFLDLKHYVGDDGIRDKIFRVTAAALPHFLRGDWRSSLAYDTACAKSAISIGARHHNINVDITF